MNPTKSNGTKFAFGAVVGGTASLVGHGATVLVGKALLWVGIRIGRTWGPPQQHWLQHIALQVRKYINAHRATGILLLNQK